MSQKRHKCIVTFRLFCKHNCIGNILGNLWKPIGQLYISASGHTTLKALSALSPILAHPQGSGPPEYELERILISLNAISVTNT